MQDYCKIIKEYKFLFIIIFGTLFIYLYQVSRPAIILYTYAEEKVDLIYVLISYISKITQSNTDCHIFGVGMSTVKSLFLPKLQ